MLKFIFINGIALIEGKKMSFKKPVLIFLALSLFLTNSPVLVMAQASKNNELNFKVYQPDASEDVTSDPGSNNTQAKPPNLFKEEPMSDNSVTDNNVGESNSKNDQTKSSDVSSAAVSDNPEPSTDSKLKPRAENSATASTDSNSKVSSENSAESKSNDGEENTAKSLKPSSDDTVSTESADPDKDLAKNADADSTDDMASSDSDKTKIANKVLQGYVRVVPVGTKIPIIMDTAVDSDTSQESDEFSARTAEDLDIDGQVAVPAGSIIRGRIAKLNPPKHLNRSGSVALKFDSVTTPDNRQIPIVANLVARGGIVHARRGLKDVAICSSMVVVPAALGLGIGYLAGSSASSSIGKGGGALIGVGVGAAIGVAIFLAKKGKKVEVRPGDELKIELGEDLRMPMM